MAGSIGKNRINACHEVGTSGTVLVQATQMVGDCLV
jgi:hypothetical protein